MECTVNRVGDTYFDQTLRNGHQDRIADLNLIAGLGIRALRYPVLWERVAPRGLQDADWRWTDERLLRLRELGVRPIAGLVHHGSGPADTNLLDPLFPGKLAAYARAVAERYPWLTDYTPINEPLTTARHSTRSIRANVSSSCPCGYQWPYRPENRAVVEAMRAIRSVNPAAQLVQTDDLGKTYSTPRLRYQAVFENERRWLGWDLLTGAVDTDHPMRSYLEWLGVDEAALGWFVDNPCPPDVVGINHYVTSERVLDEHRAPYPPDRWGGNGREAYADMEAARVRAEGIGGWRVLVAEAWERYRLPIALTEVHLGSSREEQLRWLREAWTSCQALREEMGVDVRAVTAWSLFGAYDWNHLVTCEHDFYEPGVFDLRAPEPRPTALAHLVRQLAAGEVPDHPILDNPGWWRRPDRLTVPPLSTETTLPPEVVGREAPGAGADTRPVLITGATGTLGRAFARICQRRGIAHRLVARQEMDIAARTSVNRVLDDLEPWALINTAGYVRVDDAEGDVERCMRENATGPEVLAEACAARGIRLVTFSSDLVFDGTKPGVYVESDPVGPLNVYGRSKAEAERRVTAADPTALIIRTSAFFGPWDTHNFVYAALRSLAAAEPFLAASDGVVSPTYVPDLVHTALDLLLDGERGLWHLANEGMLSWADLARRAAELAGVSTEALLPRSTAELGLPAARPRSTPLGSERGWLMPALEDALARFVDDAELLPIRS